MSGPGKKVPPRFAVFASGKGSNFRRLAEFFRPQEDSGKLVCLASDQSDCPAVAWAREHGIPVILLDYRGVTKDEVEKKVLEELQEYHPDLIVLAGFMRILGTRFVSAFHGRIVNIHPSLLPRHAGAHGIRDSFESKDQWLGITIHLVDLGMDSGPIILQKSFSRTPDETMESAEEKIHQLEHETYPLVVKALLDRSGNDTGRS